MPNDGNKIYSQTIGGTHYGVCLDRDINLVLGLPITTPINTAATSSRVNADSLFKPIPVTGAPNLTSVGKTDAQIKEDLKHFFETHTYGYTIPDVNPTPGKSFSNADFQAFTSGAIWIRKPFGNNDYRCDDLFDGYNHTVKHKDYPWGNLTLTPKKWSLIVEVNMRADPDMVFPGNMRLFSNWRVAVFVYRKGTGGGYVPVWGGCWTGLTDVWFHVGDDTSNSIIKGDTTYAAVAFMTNQAFDNSAYNQNGGNTWASNVFKTLFYSPYAQPWAEATTKPNLTEWQEAAPTITAFAAWSGTTAGQSKQFIYSIRVRSPLEGKYFRVQAWTYYKIGEQEVESSSLTVSNGVGTTYNAVNTSSGTYYQSNLISGTGSVAPYSVARTYYLRVQVDFGTTGSTGQEYLRRDILIGENLPPEAAD